MSDQTTLTLLQDTQRYLSALHGSVARHDNLAANLACAGCELRDKIATALREPAAAAPDTVTLAAVFEGFGRLLATSSRDWGQYAPDAWLWAVICGWDCDEAAHDVTCTHGAMKEMAERHGWDAATVAKARRYRATVRALTEPTTPPTTGAPHTKEGRP